MVRRGIAFSALCVALAALMPGTAQAAETCAPITGAEQLVQRPNLRWLVVGEMHGTRELPAAFGDLVCIAATARGRAVTVGLEYPPEEQERLDAYMGSSGDAAARKALLLGAEWRPILPDGRTSQAMLALIERLRIMKSTGQVKKVLAIRDHSPRNTPYNPGTEEALMGEAMRRAGDGEALTLILVGNLHAIIRKPDTMSYAPASTHLPADEALSFNFAFAEGTAWTCKPVRPGGPSECSSHAMMGAQQPGAASIAVDLPPDAPWSGTFSAGAAVSASPPAVPAEDRPKPPG